MLFFYLEPIMKKFCLISILLSVTFSFLAAQILSNFHHYSGDDGLSENTVTSMLQDKNGFMWFGTWDGLNKFDGYRFKTYKSRPGDSAGLVSNRVTEIQEDAYGFIWIMTYDGLVHRFNPRTENFSIIPRFDNQYGGGFKSQIKKIVMLKDKTEVWMLSDNDGCFCATINSTDYSISLSKYSKETDHLPSNEVNDVYLDTNGNHWILTNNGLTYISSTEGTSNILLSDLTEDKYLRPIFSVQETDDELFFGSSEGRVWRYNKENASFTLMQLPAQSDIVSIERIRADKLFFLSSSSGFFVYNMKTKDIQAYNQSTDPQLHCQDFISSYVDRMGEVWIEPNCDGVAHFDPKTQKVSFFKMNIDKTSPYTLLPNYFIFEDVNNRLWVHPRGGGFSYYDREKKELSYFYNKPGSHTRRFSNLMHSAYSDRQGNLWMCTYSSELEKVSFIHEKSLKIKPEPDVDAFSVNEVREIFEDDERFLWIATKDGTLHIFDSKRKKLGILTRSGKIASSGDKFDGMVYTIFQDKNKNIWLGTKGKGLFKVKKTRTGASFECTFEKNYQVDHNNIYSLSNNNVYSICEDSLGRLWITTYDGGINVLTTLNGQDVFYNSRNYFRNYPANDCQRARYITIDQFGNGWIGTTDGLLVFDSKKENLENTQFIRYNRSSGEKTSLGGNDVHYILCSKNFTYIAVFGGGLSIVPAQEAIENLKFETYTTLNGLTNDVVLSLIEDNDGNIWMGMKTSICKYNPQSKAFENFDETSGFFSSYFSEAAVWKSYTGELMFGSNDGFYLFYPQNMKKSNFIPSIVFSNFQLFGKDVYVKDQNSPLRVDINDAEIITLSHKQNVFGIEFAALDFRKPENIQYAYRLIGFDEDWNYSHNNRHATYTNLPHGTYTFQVRSTNGEGVWVDNLRSITIVIKPSFWETSWAILLYVVIGLLLFTLAVYILSSFYRLKNKISVEQKMTNLKLRFFTDISHELRTPLTLIAAPVEHILEKEDVNDIVRTHLLTVQKNTARMLRLINQILDFRKIQNKKMKLHIEEILIGSFVKSVCDNFVQIAEEHAIDFSVQDNTEGATIWADKDKVEKIVFNILSNAFKFTLKGKSIHVVMTKNENDISIVVKDQGQGMSKDKLKNLFERFSSSDNSIASFQPGTGIGLSLSKELIDMHHATIGVESEIGTGTTFTLKFLLGVSHYNDNNVDYLVKDSENNDFVTHAEAHSDLVINDETDPSMYEDETESSGLPTLLIIEDNAEVRTFLKMILHKKYHILEADNGKSGLELAMQEIPDFIISDLMMPEMDGMEVTEKLKSNINTSHIPIILLTAKSDKDSQLEGLKYGADDYITKPFSASHLEIRIENILKQRQNWQQAFLGQQQAQDTSSSSYMEISPEIPKINKFDQDFIEKVMATMESNIDNVDFKVDDLVSEMGMGRTVFFKKLKSITGLAPIEFIREIRIKRAAQLIESGQYTISQVTYMVGMNDPRYMSRCFKQKFGMTPSEYKDKYTKE